MPLRRLLTNATLVTPSGLQHEAMLLIENGRIAALGQGISSGDAYAGEVEVQDVDGAFVMPGLIDLHTDTLEKEITLWVEDEGEGIAPGETDAVFERFTRSTGEEPAQSGMGLGLWIVKSIVERHGGRVTAEAADHSGARILVTLPIGAAAASMERETS